MEQRHYILRLILFFVLSMTVFTAWTALFAPRPKPPVPDPERAGENVVVQKDRNLPVEARKPILEPEVEAEEQPAVAEPPQRGPIELVRHEHNDKILIGSLEESSGYFLEARLTTSGAAIVTIKLNDPRYRELDSEYPLNVVGDTDSRFLTLETSIHKIDLQLKENDLDLSLRNVDWKVETVPDEDLPGVNSAARFSYVSPDGQFEIRKTYKLSKINKIGRELAVVRNTETDGYLIDFDLSIENRSNQTQSVQYVLQGPVGLPLENLKNTQVYRNLKWAYIEKDGDRVSKEQTSAAIIEAIDDAIEKAEENGRNIDDRQANEELDKLSNAIQYIGVDVQYFAALLVPKGDQLKNQFTDFARPYLVNRLGKKGNESDISLVLNSRELEIAPRETVSHAYSLYAGPKRQKLLEPLGAADVVDYGWFGFVSKAMLGVLKFLHDNLLFPYGVAIICLTILVRSAMFPITWKQTKSAQKMKELQPKIAELKKKYANDKEKFARAQMELFSTHNYNPFAGCLPLFLQLPIFIGLYQALRNAVDLRLAPFLWFDNLAAPDALFQMPWDLPFLGQDFNLLPLLTVCLFVLQMKLFTPPAMDEQQALQQKMMMYFSIFIGFFFYHVPAGLCVYFIASSLWGIGERKLLDFLKAKAPETESAAAQPAAAEKKKPAERQSRPKKQGFWDKLLAAADAASAQTRDSNVKSSSQSKSNGAKQKKKKKKSRSRR